MTKRKKTKKQQLDKKSEEEGAPAKSEKILNDLNRRYINQRLKEIDKETDLFVILLADRGDELIAEEFSLKREDKELQKLLMRQASAQSPEQAELDHHPQNQADWQ